MYPVQFAATAFKACWDWFHSIMDATGMIPYYLAALVMFFMVQLLLIPLRGGRISIGSDIAGIIRASQAQSRTDNSGSKSSSKGGK